jgi:hypothetical protein
MLKFTSFKRQEINLVFKIKVFVVSKIWYFNKSIYFYFYHILGCYRIQHAVLSLLSMRKARPSPWLPMRVIGRRRSRHLAGGSDVTGEQTGMKKLGVEAGANLMGKELEIKETQTRPRARPPVGVNSRS